MQFPRGLLVAESGTLRGETPSLAHEAVARRRLHVISPAIERIRLRLERVAHLAQERLRPEAAEPGCRIAIAASIFRPCRIVCLIGRPYFIGSCRLPDLEESPRRRGKRIARDSCRKNRSVPHGTFATRSR